MGAQSRQIGATAEREVAKELFRELGMTFKRDLRQYQAAEYGDLICEDHDFPFSIEIKKPGKFTWIMPMKWETQAFTAAKNTGKHPSVFYRSKGCTGWKVRVYMDAVAEAVGGYKNTTTWLETDIQGFAYIAREIMAGRAKK